MFRKAKALGEQGFFEKALKVLDDLKTKNPSGRLFLRGYHPYLSSRSDKELVDQEIGRLRAIDNEREKVHKQRMKGI
jgi:hypothetical protein